MKDPNKKRNVNPYTAQPRSYKFYDIGKNVRELFPEQTKSVPRLLFWVVLILADLFIAYFIMKHFGLLGPISTSVGTYYSLDRVTYMLIGCAILLLVAEALLIKGFKKLFFRQ